MLGSREDKRHCRRDCLNTEEDTRRKIAFTEPTQIIPQLCQPLKN